AAGRQRVGRQRVALRFRRGTSRRRRARERAPGRGRELRAGGGCRQRWGAPGHGQHGSGAMTRGAVILAMVSALFLGVSLGFMSGVVFSRHLLLERHLSWHEWRGG